MSYSKSPSSLKDWEKQASAELDGKSSSSVNWETMEDIEIKPLYTSEDLEKLGYSETLPGFSPSPEVLMPQCIPENPGQFGSTLDFPPRKNQTNFIGKTLQQVKRV